MNEYLFMLRWLFYYKNFPHAVYKFYLITGLHNYDL